MHVEPKAIVDCFNHIYRRKTEGEVTSLYVDIGASGSRAFIARGTHMLFARAIAVGGDAFTRTIAGALNMNMDEAKLLRLKLANMQAGPGEVQQEERQAVAEPAVQHQPNHRRAMIEEEPAPEEEDDTAGGFALLGAALAQAAGKSTSVSSAAAEQQKQQQQQHQQQQRRANEAPERRPQATSAPAVDLRAPQPLDAQSRTVERIM